MTAISNHEMGSKKEEPSTDWGSMWIASIISFFIAIQFTIYFSSMWPYLLQMDLSSTETQFGYLTALYSFGQAVASPLFGLWSNKIGTTVIPALTGLALMIVGNFVYLFVPYVALRPIYTFMISRLLTGLGGGIVTILRTYAIQGSTVADRGRAISLNTGGFSVGLVVGPAFQMLFTPLGYPGLKVFGFEVNMYSAPAILGLVVDGASIVLMIYYFRESSVGVHKRETPENEDHARFFAMPNFDKLAITICIMTRFIQMFVITNLETIGSPLSMIMFNWDRQTTVFYNSILHVGFGAVGIIFYGINVIWDLSKKMNHRIVSILGITCILIFHLVTFPWWGLPGKIQYQEEYINVNGTMVLNPEPLGCRPSFDWCSRVPPMNVYVYFISYIVFVGLSFPILNIAMTVVYSTVIGPRNQGTMQGILMFSGSCARMVGPLFIASIFEATGPRIPWLIEIAFCLVMIAAWLFAYKRMVPLKLSHQLSAGDSFKNKYGKVIKF